MYHPQITGSPTEYGSHLPKMCTRSEYMYVYVYTNWTGPNMSVIWRGSIATSNILFHIQVEALNIAYCANHPKAVAVLTDNS